MIVSVHIEHSEKDGGSEQVSEMEGGTGGGKAGKEVQNKQPARKGQSV